MTEFERHVTHVTRRLVITGGTGRSQCLRERENTMDNHRNILITATPTSTILTLTNGPYHLLC